MDSKGRYGNIIRQARQPDNQITSEHDTRNTDTQTPKTQSGEALVKPENQRTREPEKQVNLCVKVPESWRRHWASMSKLHGVTMTDIMTQALIDKFGLPDNQKPR